MSRPARTACRFPNIQRWMDERGVTRCELAWRMGVTYNTVYYMLSGRTKKLHPSTRDSMLQVTGMTYEEAFKEADGWN